MTPLETVGRGSAVRPGFAFVDAGSSSLPQLPWWLVLAATVCMFVAQWIGGELPRYWDPDSALYILNAQNIVQGDVYGATLFVPNALNPIHPGSYPPGLPLLLAPVLAIAGLDLGALALMTYACFCGLVCTTYLLARTSVSPWPALVVATLVAFNPFLNFAAGGIYSEFPFLLAVFGAFVCFEVAQASSAASRRRARLLAVVAGALIAYAILVRTIGILLLPAVAAAGGLRWLRTGRDWARLDLPLIAMGTGTALMAAVSWAMPHDAGTYVSYFDQLSLASVFDSVKEGLRTYVPVIPDQLFAGDALRRVGSGALAPLSQLAALVAAVLAAIGLATSLWRRSSPVEMFALLYGAFILVYPIRLEPARYALPLLPLFLLYSVIGFELLRAMLGRVSGRLALGLTGIAVSLVYLPAQVGQHSPVPPPWVSTAAARDAFLAIQRHTLPSALVMVSDPTSVALFAARRATVGPEQATAAGVRAQVEAVGVTHLLVGSPASPVATQDYARFVAANDQWLRPVWTGEGFTLFAIDPGRSVQ